MSSLRVLALELKFLAFAFRHLVSGLRIQALSRIDIYRLGFEDGETFAKDHVKFPERTTKVMFWDYVNAEYRHIERVLQDSYYFVMMVMPKIEEVADKEGVDVEDIQMEYFRGFREGFMSYAKGVWEEIKKKLKPSRRVKE